MASLCKKGPISVSVFMEHLDVMFVGKTAPLFHMFIVAGFAEMKFIKCDDDYSAYLPKKLTEVSSYVSLPVLFAHLCTLTTPPT